MNAPKPLPRPLRHLKVEAPWRMLLVGKTVEIIVTGDHPNEVENQTAFLLEALRKEHIADVQELPAGASFEDLQALKKA